MLAELRFDNIVHTKEVEAFVDNRNNDLTVFVSVWIHANEYWILSKNENSTFLKVKILKEWNPSMIRISRWMVTSK